MFFLGGETQTSQVLAALAQHLRARRAMLREATLKRQSRDVGTNSRVLLPQRDSS